MSPLVSLFTKSKWTHVDICLREDSNYPPRYLSSMPFKGVRIFTLDYIKPKSIEHIRVDIDDYSSFHRKCLGCLLLKYDWSVWLYVASFKLINLPRTGWTCAGLVASMLGLGDSKTTPGDLYRKLTDDKTIY